MPHDPFLWTPAAEWAVANGLTADAVERQLQDGSLAGEHRGDGWYVARPTVSLHFPNRHDHTYAELQMLALPLGRHLTAARRSFKLPVRYDDPDFADSLDILLERLQGPEVDPVPFRLNGSDWCVDASLHFDLACALVDFEAVQHTGMHPSPP
jgi:hypothetical protein